MAFVHGKTTTIFLNAVDFSTYFNSADTTRTADTAETATTTTFRYKLRSEVDNTHLFYPIPQSCQQFFRME